MITGASGLIGGHVLTRLTAANPDCSFVAISRRPEAIDSRGGKVLALRGDLRLPHLGLPMETWMELQDRVSAIIHSAAEIRFDLPLESAREVNVEGTRTLLDLARGCRRLERFAHISTTYVAGRSEELLPESAFTNSKGFLNSYQESKYEAELLLLEAANEMPVTIYRLSSVIGDSETGKVEQYNHFHQLVRLAPRSLLPILPGSPAARLDFIATDWAAAAIAHCFQLRPEPFRVRNFCAGPHGTIPFCDALAMVYGTLGGGHPPELIPPLEFARYVRGRLRHGDLRFAQLLRALEYFLPYFSLRQNFGNAETMVLLQAADLQPLPSRELLNRVLHYMNVSGRARALLGRPVPAGEAAG